MYNLAGWLLSSALSRVQRQRTLGPAFLPFVNSHKHNSGAEFRAAHPAFSGLEIEVEEANVEWEGKGLIFVSAQMYQFTEALEKGYRFALLNPALLATYLGNFSMEVMRVVTTAEPVRLAFARCVKLVVDPRLGDAGAAGCIKECNQLFDFLVMKWHNCRIHAFTRSLTSLRESLKQQKAEMALRDKLKAGVGSEKQTATKGGGKQPSVRTQAQLDRGVKLGQEIGSATRRGLTIKHLREYIKECGRTAPSGLRKAQLQSMLRTLAHRA